MLKTIEQKMEEIHLHSLPQWKSLNAGAKQNLRMWLHIILREPPTEKNMEMLRGPKPLHLTIKKGK
jgi:hypothetical protein